MTEILIITHGDLAKEMVRVVEDIVEKPVKAIPVCFDLDLEPSEYTRMINEVLGSLDPDARVIILTDLFGGTPSNVTFPFVKDGKLEVITGFNLPVLLYLLTQKEDKDFEALCEGAMKAGKDAIIRAGKFLS